MYELDEIFVTLFAIQTYAYSYEYAFDSLSTITNDKKFIFRFAMMSCQNLSPNFKEFYIEYTFPQNFFLPLIHVLI